MRVLIVAMLVAVAGCAPRDDRDPEGEAAIQRLMEIRPAAAPPPREPCTRCPPPIR